MQEAGEGVGADCWTATICIVHSLYKQRQCNTLKIILSDYQYKLSTLTKRVTFI